MSRDHWHNQGWKGCERIASSSSIVRCALCVVRFSQVPISTAVKLTSLKHDLPIPRGRTPLHRQVRMVSQHLVCLYLSVCDVCVCLYVVCGGMVCVSVYLSVCMCVSVCCLSVCSWFTDASVQTHTQMSTSLAPASPHVGHGLLFRCCLMGRSLLATYFSFELPSGSHARTRKHRHARAHIDTHRDTHTHTHTLIHTSRKGQSACLVIAHR